MIDQLVAEYVDFALQVKNDPNLNRDVKSQIMLQQAQALAQLVPLMNGQEAELQMKQQEHAMNIEMKQQELAFKREEHQMKLQQSQSSHMMKLQQAQESHQSALVQSEQKKKTEQK